MVRVNDETVLLLDPRGTEGGHHLVFAFSPQEFEAAFTRIKAAAIPYGDSFHDVGNMRGPGDEFGARGMGALLYLIDPDQHLIELRPY
ncbi:MAG TPA: hypothetical protein VG244_09820 [Acidimicrobiales bacterium]|nr:hypothetical protein [Acidimicrobiales bacterium]